MSFVPLWKFVRFLGSRGKPYLQETRVFCSRTAATSTEISSWTQEHDRRPVPKHVAGLSYETRLLSLEPPWSSPHVLITGSIAKLDDGSTSSPSTSSKTRELSQSDRYGVPENFLEVEVRDPVMQGADGPQKYIDYEVVCRVRFLPCISSLFLECCVHDDFDSSTLRPHNRVPCV